LWILEAAVRNLSRIAIGSFAALILMLGPSAPINAIEIPKPVINIPKPNIPRPTINVPRPNVTVNVPKPVINVPRPAINVPKPAVTVNVPKPNISVNVPKPNIAVSVPKPNIQINVPNIAVSVPKPTVNVPKPADSLPAPVVAGPKPVISTPTPVVEALKPVGTKRPSELILEGHAARLGNGLSVAGPKISIGDGKSVGEAVVGGSPRNLIVGYTPDPPKLSNGGTKAVGDWVAATPVITASPATGSPNNPTVSTLAIAKSSPNTATVNLPNGAFGNARVNPDGSVTVSNNLGSVTLTPQQLTQVAAGNMSALAPLMGSGQATNSNIPALGTASGPASLGSQISGKSPGTTSQVSLPNGTFGKATVNPDGSVTVSNNLGTVTLTPQQMKNVVGGDMSALGPLTGKSQSANTSKANASDSSGGFILQTGSPIGTIGPGGVCTPSPCVPGGLYTITGDNNPLKGHLENYIPPPNISKMMGTSSPVGAQPASVSPASASQGSTPAAKANSTYGITDGQVVPDGGGGTITYHVSNGQLSAVDCLSGSCIPFTVTNIQTQNGVTTATLTGSLNGQTASTTVVLPNGSSGTSSSTSIPAAAPGGGNWNGPCEYCPGGRFMPNAMVPSIPSPVLPGGPQPGQAPAPMDPSVPSPPVPTPAAGTAPPIRPTTPEGCVGWPCDSGPDPYGGAHQNLIDAGIKPPDSAGNGNQQTNENGRCSPDPCFKSAFDNPDMTPEQMQAEVNQNRMKINEQRLQAVDGGPGAVPIYPETLVFPEAGGGAAFLAQSGDPNKVNSTVAAKATENVVGLDAAAEAAGKAVGTAASRVPIVGSVISTPAKNATTWAIKQGGSAVIDAGAEHVYSTNPE
jgi:hypothetical protein